MFLLFDDDGDTEGIPESRVNVFLKGNAPCVCIEKGTCVTSEKTPCEIEKSHEDGQGKIGSPDPKPTGGRQRQTEFA